MAVEFRRVADGDRKGANDFCNVVDTIYADDRYWVRPLDMDVKGRLSRKANPFFEHGDATAWVAYRDDEPVGRISASIDRTHLQRYDDGAGFFGFFDTVDDDAIAKGLLAKAEEWCKRGGSRVIRGPLSLNINEDVGCLIDGFDAPPMILMGHHRRYQGGLIERQGYTKLKDFYAWAYDFAELHPRAARGHQQIGELPEVTSRQINMKDFANEVKLIMDVYNDAWSDNWGFVPLSESELDKLARDLRIIMMPELTRVVYIDGDVAAVAMGIPNINEVLKNARGKLSPITIARLLWWLKVKGPQSGRLIILGIRKKYRKVRRYAALSAFLYVEMKNSATRAGMRRAELGWTLEDNAAINVGIKMMGGKVHKTYRLYEKPLDGK